MRGIALLFSLLLIGLVGCLAEVPKQASDSRSSENRQLTNGSPSKHTPNADVPQVTSWQPLAMCNNACMVEVPHPVRTEEDQSNLGSTFISAKRLYFPHFGDADAFFISTQQLAADIPTTPELVDGVIRGFIFGRIRKMLMIDINPENNAEYEQYARLKIQKVDSGTWSASYSIGAADDSIVLFGRIHICAGWLIVMEGASPADTVEINRFLNSFSMIYTAPIR